MELNSVALPKWPAFCVEGQPVTQRQAKEILIRTSNFYHLFSNDKEFVGQINKILCIPVSTDSTEKAILERAKKFDEINKKYKILELNYLHNERIVSSYVGGPHGWCDWDGKIGCNSYNIGKWPAASEVYDDWVKIADAFPFLNLRCQLWNCEAGESNGNAKIPQFPVIEYIVKDGKVEFSDPIKPCIIHYGYAKSVFEVGERGCTIEMFKDALDVVTQGSTT